ncbi:hypothetical protein KBTX_03997 [wastewater metagenome]|uniref:EamA domain-containing protein n=2 Tax=unclassified sequences TaxID=12908 RepID=A0A5B8RI83_9ZZZZ|nr:hypothetical protein KBTEX_03997 [uncultured organism]
MAYLVFVTVVWAFSFSLIGVYLAGQVDSYFAVLVRIGLATLVFAPMLRPGRLPGRLVLALMGVGAVQLGAMYVFFYQSFLLLSVPEVLLFTIFTPLYISLLDDALKGRVNPGALAGAALAVAGAAVIRYQGVSSDIWAGFLVVQGANLCFAAGQIAYRRIAGEVEAAVPQLQAFGWFYVGALCVGVPAFLIFGDASAMPTTPVQWGVLLWLGLVASGLGYFLWNKGAALTDAGSLAVMNNALIPAGLLVNVLIWNRDADLGRLALGGALMGLALWVNHLLRPRGATAAAVPAAGE